MYEITDYDKRYKPYDKSGGDLKHADWVKLPVKPKGDGIQVLLEYKRGGEVFGIWCLLLQKATDQTPENRGKLLNHKDEPASIEEIAKGISHKGKERLVEYALNVLVSMGWVSLDSKPEEASEEFRKTSPKSSVVKSRVEKSNNNKFIFDHWNKYRKQKKGKTGTQWKGHDTITPEITEAISERLKKYTVSQICQAITNYADILLSTQFEWSYAWTLRQFLTRHRPDDRNELQLYRFLENNFSTQDFTRKGNDKNDRAMLRDCWEERTLNATEEALVETRKDEKHKCLWFLIDELRPEIQEKCQ